jgi:hypothetical protein
LFVEVRNLHPEDDIQFHIRDESGRYVQVLDRGYSGLNADGRMYHPSFVLPNDAKSVSVQILVSRPLQFEFLVDPADVPVKGN